MQSKAGQRARQPSPGLDTPAPWSILSRGRLSLSGPCVEGRTHPPAGLRRCLLPLLSRHMERAAVTVATDAPRADLHRAVLPAPSWPPAAPQPPPRPVCPLPPGDWWESPVIFARGCRGTGAVMEAGEVSSPPRSMQQRHIWKVRAMVQLLSWVNRGCSLMCGQSKAPSTLTRHPSCSAAAPQALH